MFLLLELNKLQCYEYIITMFKRKYEKLKDMNKDKRYIFQLFDSISRRYEAANHILSCFMDIRWRNKLSNKIPSDKKLSILDLCCGSGSLTSAILKHCKKSKCTGIDFSESLLDLAKMESKRFGFEKRVNFLKGDVVSLPFPDKTFDYVTVAFGIRNVYDLKKCFAQANRVLKGKGHFLILEFSMPKNFILKKAFILYLNYFVPFLGLCITGKKDAYDYLKESIKDFSCLDVALTLKNSGFAEVSEESLFFGAISIYCASKGIHKA